MVQETGYTIIVPALNEAGSIRGVVEGLLHQDPRPQEIVITDAGSVDATRDIIREFTRAGSLAKLAQNPPGAVYSPTLGRPWQPRSSIWMWSPHKL